MALPVNETLEILDKVNGFYDSAWSKLITIVGWTGGALVFIGGVVTPLLFGWWQKKVLKISEEEQEGKLNDKFEELQVSLLEKIKTEYSQEIAKLSSEVEKFKSEARGNALHLQAGAYVESKDYISALGYFISACDYYLETPDWANVQRTLHGIRLTLNHVFKPGFEMCMRKHDIDLNKTLDEINKLDDRKLLFLLVSEIKEKVLQLNEVKVSPGKSSTIKLEPVNVEAEEVGDDDLPF